VALFWISTIPFGVAVHNLANFVALVVIVPLFFKNRSNLPKFSSVPTEIKLAWACLALYMISAVIGGLLNTDFNNRIGSYLAGRLSLLIFPLLILLMNGKSIFSASQKLRKVFLGVLVFWALILISQFFHSWGVRGTSIVNYGNRPEGFYSNALTTAYVLLFFFPFIFAKALQKRTLYWSIAALSISSALVVNNSRMILTVALLIAASSIVYFIKGKARIIIIAAGVSVVALTLTTKNPISHRVNSLLDQGSNVTYKGYSDHRLVFWDIYTDMIKDKPAFGHGPKLTSAYHVPYYEARGFSDFEKKYSAHNQYLQVAGSSGLIGLAFFLSWIILCYKIVIRHINDPFLKLVSIQTMTGFFLAGITQNAFQDAEVRQALMLFFIAIISFCNLKGANTSPAKASV
jgi:O-antigen ligase